MEKSFFIQSLRNGLEFFHLPSDEASLERYFQYYVLLLDWNTRMNLVSKSDMDRFVEYHLLDSLKIFSCVDFSGFFHVLDFGSGAGLPGIPLAIALPDCHFILVDSILKRTRFLETAVATLTLPNVTVLRSRAEELPSFMNASIDCVVTRATVSLAHFFHLCSRFISPNGFLVSIKGDHISDELFTLRLTFGEGVFNIREYIPRVPETVRKGHVIIIEGC